MRPAELDVPRRRRAAPVSARVRIIGWMLLLVTIALAGSIIVTSKALSVRADGLVNENLSHEADSFHTYAGSATGRSHPTVERLLTGYLRASVPDGAETFFTLVDGRPQRRSAPEPEARLDTDEAFITMVAGLEQPESGWWQSSRGRVRYGVIPVRVGDDPHRGALVILQFRDVAAAPLFDSVRVFTVVAAIALLVAGIASWLVAGRVLEPVRLVRRAAEQISESDLHRRIPVTGHDDVALLAATFNKMLDRIESSFGTQRRFLDDAGHELRTPITVIRGHLELMGEDPDERRETTALVLDELDRMNRIVEELVDLARAERPDFITLVEVELADLPVDVLANVRVLAKRDWTLDAVAEGRVLADGQRLTQALVQLVANAVQHTEQGDRIAIGSQLVDDRMRLWVSDTGEGVNPADAPHIFDRFRRGSGASRPHGGGLGLSIVRSIAEAHGGQVHLVDRPGPGATFLLDLPARLLGCGPDPADAVDPVDVTSPPEATPTVEITLEDRMSDDSGRRS